MHFNAFPKTPKIMLINGKQSLAYAVQKGAGWRADCLGDWEMFSPTWSHMNQAYPEAIQAANTAYAGFDSAWKSAPVSFEPCYDMAYFDTTANYSFEQVQESFDWGLEKHASSLNLKSHVLPARYRAIVDAALLKLGYRIRLAALSHQNKMSVGGTLNLKGTWFNDGVAPAYMPHNLTYQIVDSAGNVVQRTKTQENLRNWLPGEIKTVNDIKVNSSVIAGTYKWKIAFLNGNDEGAINLAIEGCDATAPWYSVSNFTIK